ncbi:MAG: ATP-dependent Clp protease ATP-binding subunit, partial [Anaerolineae bacterium]
MGTLNPDIPSEELSQALDAAAGVMAGFRQRVLMPEHLLLAFLDGQGYVAHKLLERFSKERGFALEDLTRAVEDQVRGRRAADVDFDFEARDGKRVPLSSEMLVVLDEGRAIARARDEIWVGTEDALAAMSQSGVSTAGLLQQRGITPRALSNVLAESALGRGTTVRDLVAQAREGQLQPVYFRQDLLRDLLNLLGLARDRHVILIGPAGVGKRSLVQALALLVAEGQGPPGLESVVEISEAALLADAVTALKAGRRKAAGGVLFLPNVHRFFGGVLKAEFPKGLEDVQRALLDDRAVVIGTAPEAEYAARMVSQSTVAEHCHVLKVPEPDHETTVEILRVHQPHVAADYDLSIADEALEVAATLAKRYLAEAVLPASALQLLHRACALLRMGNAAIATPGQAAPLDTLRPAADDRLDAEDVTLAASLMTGIPVARLGADERSRYAHMVEHLHKRIIGQDEAVLAVSRAVKTARVGLKDPRRPIGSFLFLGPTGVGKTELAKALAEFMFGSEDALLQLDMSEFMERHAVSRLVGAPPGYIGYEEAGQLTETVRRRPFSVVCFDEVEKAHPEAVNMLLQIMEDGHLTDAKGRKVDFRNAIILMTSNVGADVIGRSKALGFARQSDAARTEKDAYDDMKDKVLTELKRIFRPEFLNRIDGVMV